VERGTPGYEDDALRPLTPRGEQRMIEAARGLAKLAQPDVIVTSPLLRARQTADILLRQYGQQKARTSAALASGDNPRLLLDLEDIEGEVVMVVGHEPHLSATLSWLLTGDAHTVESDLKKGCAALIAADGRLRPGDCTLKWLLQPAALRGLA
jgi:phosphohistidine phosphatase